MGHSLDIQLESTKFHQDSCILRAPEISETSCQLLGGPVILMVIVLGAVVGHGHDVRVVVLVVVVKRVEEDAQADPLVAGSVHRSLKS